MVSIVEVEIFGFLLYSNWPVFDQKWSKLGHFGHFLARFTDFSKFLSSKMLNFFFQKSKKNYFGRKKSTFHHFDPPYDLPLLPLKKCLKCLKLRFLVRRRIRKNLEFSPRLFVRPSVCNAFSQNPFFLKLCS